MTLPLSDHTTGIPPVRKPSYLIALAFVAALPVTSPCQDAAVLERRVDSLFGDFTKGVSPGAAVVVIRDGQVERKQAVYRVYAYRELLELMGTAGFVEVKGYGSLQREPFQLGSRSAWLVARRA